MSIQILSQLLQPMYPRWVLHLIDAAIVFFTIGIISSVGIIAAPLSFIQQDQSCVFQTIALPRLCLLILLSSFILFHVHF